LRFRTSSFSRSNSSGVIWHSGHLVIGFAFPVTYDRHSVPHPLHTVMIGVGRSGLLATEHPANASVIANSAAREPRDAADISSTSFVMAAPVFDAADLWCSTVSLDRAAPAYRYSLART
jgi:hypothetical protein